MLVYQRVNVKGSRNCCSSQNLLSIASRPEWLMIPAKRKYQLDGTQLDINDKRQNSKTRRYDTTCYMQFMQLMAMRVKIWSCPLALAPTWLFLFSHGSDSWNMIILICGVDLSRYPSLLYLCIPNQAASRRYVYIYICIVPCNVSYYTVHLSILYCMYSYVIVYITLYSPICSWY